MNVSGAQTESYVVSGLMPFTNYEFFVIPYHKSIQGAPSNSMDALTAEARKNSKYSKKKILVHAISYELHMKSV